MKFLKPIFILIIIFFIVLLFLEIIPTAPAYNQDNPWIIKEGSKPFIIPHGGAKVLYPENTLYAFEKIDNDGYDVFEVDLCLTADDILISHHDVDIYNTTGIENVKVRDKTYNQLKEYNFAINFTNLNDEKPFASEDDTVILEKLVPANIEFLFQTYPEKMYILELKDTIENSGETLFLQAIEILISLIEKYNMEDNVIISSFDDSVTSAFKEKQREIITSAATNDSFKFSVMSVLKIDFFYKPTDGALILPIREGLTDSQRKLVEKVPGFISKQITTYDKVTDTYYTDLAKQGIIDDAHRHNMAILYWTVNDKETMRELIEMKVDGIITDRPDILKQLLIEMGYE